MLRANMKKVSDWVVNTGVAPITGGDRIDLKFYDGEITSSDSKYGIGWYKNGTLVSDWHWEVGNSTKHITHWRYHTAANESLTGIGDIESDAKGSGARYNSGKPDMSLIPLFTLEDEARVWEYGKKKYAAWNWAKGANWSVPLGSLLRHLSAWQGGQELDPESGLPHLAHISCNVRMLSFYAKTYPEGDDRSKWVSDFYTNKSVQL